MKLSARDIKSRNRIACFAASPPYSNKYVLTGKKSKLRLSLYFKPKRFSTKSNSF
jgi:hypothetical protein